jgi:hypothetical protein
VAAHAAARAGGVPLPKPAAADAVDLHRLALALQAPSLAAACVAAAGPALATDEGVAAAARAAAGSRRADADPLLAAAAAAAVDRLPELLSDGRLARLAAASGPGLAPALAAALAARGRAAAAPRREASPAVVDGQEATAPSPLASLARWARRASGGGGDDAGAPRRSPPPPAPPAAPTASVTVSLAPAPAKPPPAGPLPWPTPPGLSGEIQPASPQRAALDRLSRALA